MTAGKLLERKSPVGGLDASSPPRERTSAGSAERCHSVPSSSEAPLGSDLCPLHYRGATWRQDEIPGNGESGPQGGHLQAKLKQNFE